MKVDELLSEARDALTVKRVFGEPYERDGVTIVPVATFAGGGGGGADGSPEGGSGGGFGMAAKPAGVYVIRDGQVSWQPAVDVNRAMIFALAALLVFRSVLRRRSKASAKAKARRKS
jgi:uncharacterized spore protein YtfJ